MAVAIDDSDGGFFPYFIAARNCANAKSVSPSTNNYFPQLWCVATCPGSIANAPPSNESPSILHQIVEAAPRAVPRRQMLLIAL